MPGINGTQTGTNTGYHIYFTGYENSQAANVAVNWNSIETIHQADILGFGPGAAFGNVATIGWIHKGL